MVSKASGRIEDACTNDSHHVEMEISMELIREARIPAHNTPSEKAVLRRSLQPLEKPLPCCLRVKVGDREAERVVTRSVELP